MLSDNMRDFLRAAAWILIVAGVLAVVFNGLRQLGLVSPGVVNVNGNPISSVLGLIGAAAASVVQGGILLAALSIDERVQNRGA